MKFCMYIIVLLLTCIGITSCGTNKTNKNIDVEKEVDSIDYTLYLRKTWVVDDWDGGAYNTSFSFIVTKIENGIIEGRMSLGSVIVPDFYSYSFESPPYYNDFTGTIDNGVAEFHFNLLAGQKGSIELKFNESNKIEGSIKFTDKGDTFYENLYFDGNYLFRPYSFADIKGVDPLKKHSFETNLDSWGTVNFVTVVFTGNKPTPDAYLTNEYDEILYHLCAPYQVGTEIVDVVLGDINGDGLKDLKMTTNYEEVEWIFYQMDNGLFYDSKLVVK